MPIELVNALRRMETEPPLPDARVTAPTPGPRSSAEQDLQLCRRIDWRFLLPQSALGDVGYMGGVQETLVSALRRFSQTLTVLTNEQRAGASEQKFDLLVLISPSLETFQHAARLLKRDGWLYAELEESLWHPRRTKSFTEHMRRLGFCSIKTYWHRPNFEACREIVPLDHSSALQYVLSRNQSDFPGRMKAFAARSATKAGILEGFLSSCSLIAQKSSNPIEIA